MIVDQAAANLALKSLRSHWWIAFLWAVFSLLCGYGILQVIWHPVNARRWAMVAACTLALLLRLLRQGLKDNYSPGDNFLLPTLGIANTITLVRGLAIGFLAGFLFSPWPPGRLAWIPGLLYSFVIVGDFFDGYVSRRINQITELGKKLDMEFDSLGALVAVFLAVQYHQLPVWFLFVGVAHYLFVFAIRWRERKGRPVGKLPPSRRRRIIGGCMTGFLSVALWPLFSRPTTTIFGTIFAAAVVVSVVRDWLLVSGRRAPTMDPAQTAQRKLLPYPLNSVTNAD